MSFLPIDPRLPEEEKERIRTEEDNNFILGWLYFLLIYLSLIELALLIRYVIMC